MISYNELKEKFETMGYYATDELLYDAYNALALFSSSSINPGQDIFAICLEGPPGSGKTEFAKIYTKVSNALFKNVELVDYQCDATTGKTELFEDINISAAIRGDADHVNIPGKLIEAIKKVNEGKRIVLFLDEYDKAREETDAFLLKFLQSGNINSTQHGDLEIKDEYKSNLQVILCKNDMREELSGPLSRRVRIIRLDYMHPALFHKIANRLLIEEQASPVNDGLLNLVCLLYEKAYDNKDLYNRLPSCSEMLISIEDADRILKLANAPKKIIYNILKKNMFKSKDDIETFEASLKKANNQTEKKLANLIKTMESSDEKEQETKSLHSLITENILAEESKKLIQKTKEMEELIERYQTKFAQMEEERQKAINEEIEKIKLANGKLVSTTATPDVINNFTDESSHVKRGYDIFKLSNDNWTEVATISRPNLSHSYTISKLIENAQELDVKIYENGILIQEYADQKLIVINSLDSANKPIFKVLSNLPVIPAPFIQDISNFAKFIEACYSYQPKTAKEIADETLEINTPNLTIDALIYDDTELPFTIIEDNVYHFEYASENLSDSDYFSTLKCDNLEKATEISKKIMTKESKVLKK